MNIKTLFSFDQKESKYPRINPTDKLYQNLLEILTGKRSKMMGDLAKSFGIYFKKMNLEKADTAILTLFCMLRKLQMLKSPENIKALIYLRAKLNGAIANNRSEEAIIFNLLFENCYRIIFETQSKEEIILRSNYFCSFFEEILLNINPR